MDDIVVTSILLEVEHARLNKIHFYLSNPKRGGLARGELAKAAGSLALHSVGAADLRTYFRECSAGTLPSIVVPTSWPYHITTWKPQDARSDLVLAAALIVAEIERRDSVNLSTATGERA